MKSINDKTVQSEINLDQLTLIVASASWCGPCRTLKNTIEQIDTKINLFEIDIDENEEFVLNYGIRSIPTMIIFKNGDILDRRVGNLSKPELIKFLESYGS